MLAAAPEPHHLYARCDMADKDNQTTPSVGIVLGSKSDLPCFEPATEVLTELGIGYELKILSAHRTPDETLAYGAGARDRGLMVLIAGAGAAAALPGLLAAKTTLPVLGVPIPSTDLNGLDALLAIVQMPGGVPVGTLAIGKAGAKNAALLAAQIIALTDGDLHKRIETWRSEQSNRVLSHNEEQLRPTGGRP